MAKNEYSMIIVESYQRKNGTIHIRPCPNQEPFLVEMAVECSKALIENYPIGTKFEIKAKLTSREGSAPFVYSSYALDYKELK